MKVTDFPSDHITVSAPLPQYRTRRHQFTLCGPCEVLVAGRAALADARPRMAATDDRLMALISPGKREAFLNQLRLLAQAEGHTTEPAAADGAPAAPKTGKAKKAKAEKCKGEKPKGEKKKKKARKAA